MTDSGFLCRYMMGIFMKDNTKEQIKNLFSKERILKRLPYALLAGFTPSFMFFFFGVLEIFAGNHDELGRYFAVSDFILPILLVALASSVFISALILFLPKNAALAVFGLFTWLALMGYVQVLFDALLGTGSLSNDTGVGQSTLISVINIVIWAAAGVTIIAGALLMQKKTVLKRVYLIGLLVIFVMLAAGCVSQIGKMSGGKQEETVTEVGAGKDGTDTDKTDENDPKNAYLTTVGLDSVSKGKNIVIFVVDRFDVSYYKDAIKNDPDTFAGLDGFTYFSDNISLYSRTWPAVPTMITGIDNDFSVSPDEYFAKAYTESPFLLDLKNNGYKIKLYTQDYYCYRDGTPLVGVADNISYASEYVISDTGALIGNLFALSAYRYLPNAFKDTIYVSTGTFSNAVDPLVTDELKGGEGSVDTADKKEAETEAAEDKNNALPRYKLDDPPVCQQILENGLSFDGEGNSYILIHLNGCHTPSNMDADCNRLAVERKDIPGALEQMRGCFKMIYFYLDEMKRLGIYDDATIVITGDHPRARDDKKIPEQPRLTSLFVKPAGSRGELAYSNAQVSQENFIPTLVKSSGIKTENDYGRTYFEVPEGENTVRYHKFELSGTPNKIVVMKVTGKGEDFSNWQIESYIEPASGSFYK